MCWLGFGAGAVVSGCSGGGPSPEQIAEEAAEYERDLVCDDTTGLWPAEVKTREDNNYRDLSEKPPEYCFSCLNFVKPPTPDSCGTCRTVKGPVSPLGWCESWARRS